MWVHCHDSSCSRFNKNGCRGYEFDELSDDGKCPNYTNIKGRPLYSEEDTKNCFITVYQDLDRDLNKYVYYYEDIDGKRIYLNPGTIVKIDNETKILYTEKLGDSK